nr:Hypothetical protein SC2p2_00220 [Methylocystis sp. SC2]
MVEAVAPTTVFSKASVRPFYGRARDSRNERGSRADDMTRFSYGAGNRESGGHCLRRRSPRYSQSIVHHTKTKKAASDLLAS